MLVLDASAVLVQAASPTGRPCLLPLRHASVIALMPTRKVP